MQRVLLVLALANVACTTRAKGTTEGPGGGEGSLLPQDQTFTLKDVEVRGVAFEPQALGLPVFIPPIALTTDNAAMIAAAGHVAWRRGERADLALNAEPHLALG